MTKEDLGQIRQVVREEVEGKIAPLDRKIGVLDQKVDEQFHYLNQKIDRNHETAMAKFDQFKQMESEDVIAVQGDVEDLKLRVTKLETGRV